MFTAELAAAGQLDRDDPMAGFRRRFHIPRLENGQRPRPMHYLCGHSLGLMPRRAAGLIEDELERWARLGVGAHFDSAAAGWYAYHERFAAPLARLTGARRHEVVAMNSLTVNLHLMLATFYRPTAKRHAILIEPDAFSSDRYALASQIRLHGGDPRKSLLEAPADTNSHPRRAGMARFDMDRYAELLRRRGSSIAIVLLPAVQYLTGEAFDIATLTRLAHERGCIVGFDLAHAIGNTRLRLHRDGPDFAVWCSYKYLNGGPGAIGGAFVHERHARDTSLPRLAGWWGHDKSKRFAMEPDFRAMPGAEGWQISNPPILAMAALASSLELFDEAGLRSLSAKSRRLTAYLQFLLEERLGDRIELITPRDPARRGAQLSLRILRGRPAGARLAAALRSDGVVVDVREPDVLRIAPVPLYNRFADVHAAVSALERHIR